MTERGLPSVDGAPACPFVAFEDDRESRSTSPDHRHRCYAEPLPAPRAAAHQEAYCLSSAFPVCPTFQDWARREAAHARGEGERPAAGSHRPPRGRARRRPRPRVQPTSDEDDERDASERRTPRHVAAEATDAPPPPLEETHDPAKSAARLGGAAALGVGRVGAVRARAGRRRWADAASKARVAPQFLAGRSDESRGLAGSAADRLASGVQRRSGRVSLVRTRDRAPSSAAAPRTRSWPISCGRRAARDRPVHGYQPPARPETGRGSARPGRHRRATRSSGRPGSGRAATRRTPRSGRGSGFHSCRASAVLAVALAIAAVGLFFLPALLGVGGGGGGVTSTASPSARPGHRPRPARSRPCRSPRRRRSTWSRPGDTHVEDRQARSG